MTIDHDTIAKATDYNVNEDFSPRSGGLATAVLFIEAGFEAWDEGGGCQSWRQETVLGGRYVKVTPEDGVGGLPEDGEAVMACVYPDGYGLGDDGVTDEDEEGVEDVGTFPTVEALMASLRDRKLIHPACEGDVVTLDQAKAQLIDRKLAS